MYITHEVGCQIINVVCQIIEDFAGVCMCWAVSPNLNDDCQRIKVRKSVNVEWVWNEGGMRVESRCNST